MEITTKNRDELKSYFKKNSIPTEEQFAFLIEGMINPQDDGVVKSADTPLSIQAAGDEDSPRPALHLYENISDADPAWTIGITARTQLGDEQENTPGFHISDNEGNSRLYIDQNSGNIGIGTNSPQETLHLRGNIRGKGEGALTIRTRHGHVHVGPVNESWSHFLTDREKYYFNKPVYIDSGILSSYSEHHLSLQTNGTTRVFVDNKTGYVGIGRSDPLASLNLAGGKWDVSRTNGDFMIGNKSYNLRIGVALAGNGAGDVSFRAEGKYNRMMFGGGTHRSALTVRNNSVGIRTMSPDHALHVVGNIRYTGSISKTSSITLKHDVVPLEIEEANNILKQLNPVTYHMKEDPNRTIQVGFIAEEVPDLISIDNGSAIIESHITAVLTKVVKELQDQIAELTSKLNETDRLRARFK